MLPFLSVVIIFSDLENLCLVMSLGSEERTWREGLEGQLCGYSFMPFPFVTRGISSVLAEDGVT